MRFCKPRSVRTHDSYSTENAKNGLARGANPGLLVTQPLTEISGKSNN